MRAAEMENASGAAGIFGDFGDLFGTHQHTEISEKSQGLSEDEALAKALNWDDEPHVPMLVPEPEYKTEAEFQAALKKALSWDDEDGTSKPTGEEIKQEAEKSKGVLHQINDAYAVCQNPPAIIRLSQNDVIRVSDFDFLVEHLGLVAVGYDRNKDKLIWKPAAKAWRESPGRRTYSGLTFSPGDPKEVDSRFNTWTGWGCEPRKGDVGPFLQLGDYLYGSDFHTLLQWFAYPLQNSGQRPNFASVQISHRQGVGKNLLNEAVAAIHGQGGKVVTASEFHQSFNSFLKNATFVVVDENDAGDRRASSDKLKHVITGTTISINEKFRPAYTIKNCASFVFLSNHPDAVFLEQFDRRYFVLECRKRPLAPQFYADFVTWRDGGGISALFDYLLSLDLQGFDAKGHAPTTAAKGDMQQISLSELERWLVDFAESAPREVYTVEEISRLYRWDTETKTTTTAIGRALHRFGLTAKARPTLKTGKRPWLVAVRESDKWEHAVAEEWVNEYSKPDRRLP